MVKARPKYEEDPLSPREKRSRTIGKGTPGKERNVMRKAILLGLCQVILGAWVLIPAWAAESTPLTDEEAAQLLGRWIIVQTKEPGKPYRDGYKGRPFVPQGHNAFTLIMEYRKDGTFRRISRVGEKDTVHEGGWRFSGHELRHKRKESPGEEVMHIRFDNPNQYTSIEVYEDTPDPGLFARFKRIE